MRKEQYLIMSEEYNRATAFHYASYRPPLHAMILERALAAEERFDTGLDVGCGTGYSAIALAKYCSHVYGIDPSEDMLSEAQPWENVTYRLGAGEALPVPDQSVDVVTFAGSLVYAKSALLVKELQRVCRPGALLIPYDFQVLVDDVLRQFDVDPEAIDAEYDHEISFSDCPAYTELIKGKEQIALNVSAAQLAHILLASSQSYAAFVSKYGVSEPFTALVDELEQTGRHHDVKASIFFSQFRAVNNTKRQ